MSYTVGDYDLRDIQKVMADMMADIDRVCSENKLRYILDGGTMLGAVRHNGFIPWDDDLDIAMPRDDYEKFIDIANSKLNSKYRFQCYENTKEYPYNFGKVRAVNTLYREELTGSLKINHGIYIDVFPMDYVDIKKPKGLTFVQKQIAHLTQLRYAKLGLCKGLKYIPFKILPLSTINKLLSKLMKYRLSCPENYVQKLCHFGKNKPPINISLFNDVIRVPFEEYQFNIPCGYDAFLKDRYGDYMTLPPPGERQPVHEIKEIRL